MALRPDRDYNLIDDISHFWTDAAADAENGGVASMKTAGSGVSLDDAANVVEYKADPSGAKPMGVLLQNIKHYAAPACSPTCRTGHSAWRQVHAGSQGLDRDQAISGTPRRLARPLTLPRTAMCQPPR